MKRSAVLSIDLCSIMLIALGIAVSAPFYGQISDPARSLDSYQKLQDAVLSGKTISVKTDLAACKIHGTNQPGPQVVGVQHFENFMVRPSESIAFATTHFTVKADDTAVNEFLSLRVSGDGKVEIRNRFLDASTNKVYSKAEFDCELSKGVVIHW